MEPGMESDDDYNQIPVPEEQPSSPIYQRKLKRLKKATRVSNPPTAQLLPASIHSSPLQDLPTISDLQSSKPADEEKLEHSVDNGRGSPNELDELFTYKDRAEDEMMYNAEGEDRLAVNQGNRDQKSGEEKPKSAKKRRGSKEGQVEEKKNNKSNKRSKKSDDDKGNSQPSAPTKKKLEKERKAHLQHLHAESQRLLRETRDAAFKPVPLVQRPISSILEKIRQRKLEVSNKVGMLNNHGTKEVLTDLYSEQVDKGNLEDIEHVEDVEKDMPRHEDSNSVDVNVTENCSEPASIPSPSRSICASTALVEESKSAFRAPIDDTQDLFNDSEQSDGEASQDSQEENQLEEVLAPSVLTMNLRLDSAPIDDISQENDDSDDENDDKENIAPHPLKQTDIDSNPKCDPVKAFVDDEAEEDDSDNDLMRLKDNEDDEEIEDSEEFNDMIVTAYDEKPSDNMKRDQLHQMWLEQQDATATDNVLQRLKCNGNQHRVPIALEEVEGEEDGDYSEDSMDVADDMHPRRVARINSKKMKQMIPQMFTDKDDVYLSSDDEETEQKLVKMRLLEKAEKHTSFLSPAEDENSREVFGLIRKLNIAPDPKKKSKSSSIFDTLITGGNSNSSSKSSFLGRASSISLPSSNKTGSSTFRSFIFSRDDSNSRSTIIASEASTDMGEKSDLPTKTTRAKFSNSQPKSNSQSKSETSSSSSLLEVLRKSTQAADQSVRNNSIAETQIAVQFAAFKSSKKSIKAKP